MSGLLESSRIAVGADGRQHLRGGGVVALVLAVAEGEVGLVGVQAGVLQRVGVELGVEADAPALLAQVEQEAAGVGDPLGRLAQLRAAVAPLGAEHVAGEALAVRPHQRRGAAGGGALERPPPVAEAEQQVLLAVGQSGEGEDVGRGRVAVGEPQRHGHLRPDGGLGRHRARRGVEGKGEQRHGGVSGEVLVASTSG